MLRRDGTGRPWVGKDEQLTQVERNAAKIIDVRSASGPAGEPN